MEITGSLVSTLQILTSIGSAVLFLFGFIISLKDIQFMSDSAEEEDAHAKASFKKSMIFIACGIGVYVISSFFEALPHMAANYGVAAILLQAFFNAMRKTGPLLLLPFVIRWWRRSARRRTYR